MTMGERPDGATHRWRFFRAGGFDQALIETGADLASLATLDPKLWVALSCPVTGVELDVATLACVDTDGDGQIRTNDVLAAIRFACDALTDPEILVRKTDALALTSINQSTEAGRAVLAGARLVLANLGKPDATTISLAEASDVGAVFAAGTENGDGVVPLKAVTDPGLHRIVEEILSCLPGIPDLCGEPGVDAAIVERFFADAEALDAWRRSGENPVAMLLGPRTGAAFALFRNLSPKIEDYFQRCRLAAFDPKSVALFSPSEDDYRRLAATTISSESEELAAMPLAVPDASKPLPFADAVNPAFEEMLNRFAHEIVAPLMGPCESLSDAAWRTLVERFTFHAGWAASKPDTVVERIEPARLRAIVGGKWKADLLLLCARDAAVAPQVKAVASAEKLLRLVRDLHPLVNNFVSFRNFYTRKGKAAFQAGTLYIDGRSCDLCVHVSDASKHASIATLSRLFLVYCECVRGTEKMTIAAAVTAGDADQLMVGRNGVFFDRSGREWGATVVRIVEHPISIRQAVTAPYRRMARLIGEQANKFASAKSKATDDHLAGVVTSGGKVSTEKGQTPFDIARFAGIFAAIGLAVGAIGSAVASMVTGMLGLAWWQMPIAMACLPLIVSGPSVFLAWMKLRQRNLGPILDASGWAVNARAKINIPFGASLTATANLPENAERILYDPFAEKKRPWRLCLFVAAAMAVAALIAWKIGLLSCLTCDR